MKTKKAALILYVISCLTAIIASFLDIDLLILVSRPTVVPAIFFYYLSIKRKKVDLLFALVLVLNFIGDVIILLEFENSTLILMVPYFLSYLALLKFAIEDTRKIKFNKSGLGLSVFVFSGLMCLMYALIQMFIDAKEGLVIPVIIYGIVLAAFCSLTAYCFYSKNATFTFYMLMTALASVFSDVFYVMFSLIFHFPSFYYFEFAMQLASYFFMVKYFVLRKK
jgi:hypothetical protein